MTAPFNLKRQHAAPLAAMPAEFSASPPKLRAEPTPGDWHVSRFSMGVWSAEPDSVDSVRIFQAVEPEGGGVSKDEALANLRLAAAAKDLLAELQAAHALLALALKHLPAAEKATFALDSERTGLGLEGATRFHERAAAIAKATGSIA